MAIMNADPRRAGACLVRAEVQGEHVLISVTTSSGLDRHLHAARAEKPRHFVDVDQALALIGEFLRSFDDDGGVPPDGDTTVTDR